MARDAAKQNEQNLSKLSRSSLRHKLKDAKNGVKKVYQFKKASSEVLESIRLQHEDENRRLRIKRIVFFTLLLAGMAGVSFYFLILF